MGLQGFLPSVSVPDPSQLSVQVRPLEASIEAGALVSKPSTWSVATPTQTSPS